MADWTFETKNFSVEFSAEEERDLDLSFDDDGSIAEGLDSGKYVAFCAMVRVIYKPTGAVVGGDSLGGCIYESVEEFITSHRDSDPMNRNCSIMRAKHPAGPKVSICHYFPDMIAEAVANARKNVNDLCSVHLRAA